MSSTANPARCFWVPTSDELYCSYHDQEWGFPVSDDRRLFEKLSLEAFQSGLSWRTILGKRENFRTAFADFRIEVVAGFGDSDVERLVGDAGIVRHRGKILATINNAGRALEAIAEHGSLAAWFWSYADPTGDLVRPRSEKEVRSRTTSPSAVALSKALKKAGWKHVGPTTVFSFMQAAGMVNDHHIGCVILDRVVAAHGTFSRPG